jgi:superfamily II DNA or RNA helicase
MSKILNKEGYLLKKSDFPEDKIIQIRKELIVKPYQTFKVPNMPVITYPVYQENDDYLCIPKFYGLKKFGKPDEDYENDGIKVNYKFLYKPRKTEVLDQNEVIKDTIKKIDEIGGGLICAGCGAGKTFMGLYIAHHYKVKTLIIVHKTFLLNQWVEKINEYTDGDCNVGIIQQNKIEVEGKDIVIGMLQSIAKQKYDSDIFMDFGMVIFDEAHHAPSKYFSKALPIVNCKKSLALSATPKRSDRMEKVLYWYLGDICYKAPPNKNTIVKVNLYNYDLKHNKFAECYMRTGDVNRPRTINRIVKLKKRNKFILNLLFEIMKEECRQCLILSDRIEHLEKLKEKIDENGNYTCDYYIGGKSQKKLDEAAKAQILLGSYGMASEGLDIPSLNTLILTTPRSKIEQSAGRIVRKIGKVQPLIVDIIDQLPCFVTQGIQRKKTYNKLEYNITLHEVEDNKILEVKDEVKTKKEKTIKKNEPKLDDNGFIV